MFEIRPLTDADVDATAEMHARTWQAAYAGIVPQSYLDGLDPARIAVLRREQPIPTLLAVRDGVIVGNAGYGDYRNDDGTTNASHGELLFLYAAPEEWGRGTGKALLDAVEKEMIGTWPDVRLWVLVDNARARAFYERNGFAPDGESDMWTPNGTSAQLRELRYAKPL